MQNRLKNRCGMAWKARIVPLGLLLMGLLLMGLLLVGCGGGGGGGGGVAPATVTGRVLRAETNTAPNPAATITGGGQSKTAAADGTFSLSLPSNTTTLTITADPAKPRTLTIALAANQTTNLGDIFLSDTGYTANTSGTVRRQDTNQPIGAATVTIAGATTTTKTDGTFSFTGLPVGLGTLVNASIGTVKASGFEDKPIIPAFVFVAGDNPLGDILIAQPIGTVPLPPFTITGKVTVGGVAMQGISVQLTNAGNVSLGSTTTDATGSYFFWVVPGTYTATASNNGTRSVTVTLNSADTPVTAPPIAF